MTRSILLTGVGGQGVLLIAGVIASAAEAAGYNVTTNEIHGMAQRGGSVTAQVRYSTTGDTLSPLALVGSVDVLVSMEHIEALRYAHWLKPDGFAVVAKTAVVPVTVSTGACTYPADVEARLHQAFPRLVYEDCVSLALELGNAKLANTILAGALTHGLPEITLEQWKTGLLAKVKPATAEANIKAFERGLGLCTII